MTKVILAFALCFSLTIQSSPLTANMTQPTLELTGQVVTVRRLEAQSGEIEPVRVSTMMNLTNRGLHPAVLLSKRPTFCWGADAVAAYKGGEKVSVISSYPFSGSSEFVSSDQWKDLKRSLDVSEPPKDMTHILAPGSTLEFEYEFQLNFPTAKGKRYSVGYKDQLSFQQILELSPIYVSLRGCDFRNYGIEDVNDDGRISFGDTLKRRWSKHGDLLLTTLDSQPMVLDLRPFRPKSRD